MKNQKQKIKELYLSGLSQEKIMKKLGLGRYAVRAVIERSKIMRTISQALKGKHNSRKTEFKKGMAAPTLGKIKNGGGRDNKFYHDFRREVLIRDKFTCQQCGEVETNIVVHHIKDFHKNPDLRFDVNNGQTLCRACHCKVHNPAKKVSI